MVSRSSLLCHIPRWTPPDTTVLSHSHAGPHPSPDPGAERLCSLDCFKWQSRGSGGPTASEGTPPGLAWPRHRLPSSWWVLIPDRPRCRFSPPARSALCFPASIRLEAPPGPSGSHPKQLQSPGASPGKPASTGGPFANTENAPRGLLQSLAGRYSCPLSLCVCACQREKGWGVTKGWAGGAGPLPLLHKGPSLMPPLGDFEGGFSLLRQTDSGEWLKESEQLPTPRQPHQPLPETRTSAGRTPLPSWSVLGVPWFLAASLRHALTLVLLHTDRGPHVPQGPNSTPAGASPAP